MDRNLVHTIGHSNHELEHFFDLLRLHRIEVIADVRSHPYCGYSIHFNREAIQAAAKARGFQYVYLGDQIGGRPADDRFYDADGHVLYWKLAGSKVFEEGIERVRRGMRQYRIALMCSEENPSVCHRRLLISRVLHESGVEVAHIRGDGRIETEAELRKTEAQPQTEQLSLFVEEPTAEVNPWRSLRSGLRRKTQPDSSDSSGEPA